MVNSPSKLVICTDARLIFSNNRHTGNRTKIIFHYPLDYKFLLVLLCPCTMARAALPSRVIRYIFEYYYSWIILFIDYLFYCHTTNNMVIAVSHIDRVVRINRHTFGLIEFCFFGQTVTKSTLLGLTGVQRSGTCRCDFTNNVVITFGNRTSPSSSNAICSGLFRRTVAPVPLI